MIRRLFAATLFSLMISSALNADARTTLNLDGKWQVAEGSMTTAPQAFPAQVPVPGLLDQAEPAFADIGVTSTARQAFWYRRSFRVDEPITDVALLKIHKAAFGTRAILNGVELGEHLSGWTPAFYDAKKALRVGENELLVRVGAHWDVLPKGVTTGFDPEKKKFIPGIFDSVELILAGTPFIDRLQVVPDLGTSSAYVRAYLRYESNPKVRSVNWTVREAKSGRTAGKVTTSIPAGQKEIGTTIPIHNCRLWSPEDPFLYEVEVDCVSDKLAQRFGMRSFRLDPQTGRAVLNGKPYFMRGSNITLYRFFEDSARGSLPWDKEWVRNFHKMVRGMHWNSLRYCIGFPPEFWYDIADEEGVLIQDEYPLWHNARRDRDVLSVAFLAQDYSEWMRERWNHPSVVIWDAQNETVTPVTGRALEEVRDLDLSNRPWDNGWGPAQAATDSYESHPYVFNNPYFRLSKMEGVSGTPKGSPQQRRLNNPIIINEYGWLWLQRNGMPTTLSRRQYELLLGKDATPEERRHFYARTLAALTEFWRCNRACAGVLHFCSLAYTRPDGQTSDHFLDVAALELEPNFVKYVRDAFSPVGLMIDFWKERVDPGSKHDVGVQAINDTYDAWSGKLLVQMKQGESNIARQEYELHIPAFGEKRTTVPLEFPEGETSVTIEASLIADNTKPVSSLRDVKIGTTSPEAIAQLGIALNKPARASSNLRLGGERFDADAAVDGDMMTRWSSNFSDNEWFQVDLLDAQQVSRIVINWENAYAKAFKIEVSVDGASWSEIYRNDNAPGDEMTISIQPVTARYIRMTGVKRATRFGYSIFEFRVFK